MKEMLFEDVWGLPRGGWSPFLRFSEHSVHEAHPGRNAPSVSRGGQAGPGCPGVPPGWGDTDLRPESP